MSQHQIAVAAKTLTFFAIMGVLPFVLALEFDVPPLWAVAGCVVAVVVLMVGWTVPAQPQGVAQTSATQPKPAPTPVSPVYRQLGH